MFNTIVAMSKDLLKMDVDTYNKTKCTLKSYVKGNESLAKFINTLFELVDEKRPLLLEMH